MQQSSPRVANKITHSVLNFNDSIDIPKHFFDDNMFSSYERMVKEFADMARVSRDDYAMGRWRGSFDTLLTADGVSLINDSHTTISGHTVDNKITAAFSNSGLNTAINNLGKQKNQAGVVRGHMPHCLLVSFDLFKKACETVESDYRDDNANNVMNVYSSKYGIYIATSPYLSTDAGQSSDAYWWLLGKDHAMTRWQREGVQTTLTPYQYTRNWAYVYAGEFREVIGATDYNGIVGSDGTI